MNPLNQSPVPAGPNSKVCVSCQHPLGSVVRCGDEDCPNPLPRHFHCVYLPCRSQCKKRGICRPRFKVRSEARVDLDILKVVSFKLSTDGSLPPDRTDIRDVGKIRTKYGLAQQRDDEKYSDYLERLVIALESEKDD